MKTLTIELNNNAFQIELLPELCPKTLKKLENHLPFRTELHYAKIAGEEIMSVMPFSSSLENALEVSQARAGMLVFWPDRHVLCLYYGQMQEEAAAISLLGYLKGGPEQFAQAGEHVRRGQGKKMTFGTFYVEIPKSAVPMITPTHATLHPFEFEIWEKIPDEIFQLTCRTGIMRPVGPLLYAEADTHAFHEYLASSILILPDDANQLIQFSNIFCRQLKAFHNKMSGWYMVPKSASVIEAYLIRFSQTCDAGLYKSLLENFMFFVGRLNYWFDALIPWNVFNEHMKRHPIRR